MLKAFDAPSREECTAERPVSNTPAAALALLNDVEFVEACRVLAEHAMRNAEPQNRVTWMWRRVLSRPPDASEVALLTELVDRHRKQYESDPDAAIQLISVGDLPTDEDLDASELAAWTSVARVLFNLDETITRN